RLLDERSGAARGDQLDAGLVQAADQGLETGLVEDGDQRAADRDLLVGAVVVGRGDRRHWGSSVEFSWRRAPRRSMLIGARAGHSLVVAHLRQSCGPRLDDSTDPDAPALDAPALA